MHKAFEKYWNHPQISVQYFAGLALLALCYTLTGRFGLSLDAVDGFATLVWPPSGIALAALMIFGVGLWPGVFLGALLVNLPHANWVTAFGIGLGNTLEAVVAYWILTHYFRFWTTIERFADLVGLLAVAAVCPVIAATVGLLTVMTSQAVVLNPLSTWYAWWFGDAMGILLVGSLLLTWISQPFRIPSARKLLEALFLGLVLSSLAALVYMPAFSSRLDHRILTYLFYPLMIWTAFHFKMKGAISANFLISVVAIACAIEFAEPFPDQALGERLLYLQFFLASLLISSMFLAAMIRELEFTREQAEILQAMSDNASQIKSNFIATVSHEIRTPLSAIIGFSELLMNSELSQKERKEFLEIVIKNGRHLGELVDSILDLSKMESGHLQAERLPISLEKFMSEMHQMFAGKARLKGLRVFLNLNENLPPMIYSDPLKIRQILNNIVGNALKFTQRGHITINCESLSNEQIMITVTDTGHGIGDNQRVRLFKNFSQADGSINREFGGTGLGLMISKKIAQALGGDLSLIESQLRRGSVFRIVLAKDLKFHNSEITPLAQADTVSAEKLNISGANLLLIEDSPVNQLLVERYLAPYGVVVESVDNGEIGVATALKNNFDIVLMDLNMPILDGYEATAKLRQNGFTKPIIALTAENPQEISGALEGFDGCLAKPLFLPQLVSTIARHIREDV